MRVRTALESARDPAALIFDDLPAACGFEPFRSDAAAPETLVKSFVDTLRKALDELKGAYPALLTRMTQQVAAAIEEERWPIDRARIAGRASRVSLAAKEPRLRSFSLRLRDPGLSESAWIEALGSFVLRRPPTRWTTTDEARWREELAQLGGGFRRIEAVAFADGSSTASTTAMRLGVTRADGSEVFCVVDPHSEHEQTIQSLVDQLEALLPSTREVRLGALSRLLWEDLSEVSPQQDDMENSNKIA
jgi:hypothetical protein